MTENPLLSRRNLMKLGVIPATGALAGCIGGDDGDGTDDGTDTATGTATPVDTVDPSDLEGVRVEGQTLTLPIGDGLGSDPSEMTFLFTYDRRWHDVDSNLQSSSDVERIVTESAIAGRWYSSLYYENPGRNIFQLYEDIEITQETVSVTIADDAYWSDGEPCRAKDIYGGMATTIAGRHMPEQGTWEPPTSAGLLSAPYSVDMPDGPDGKEIVFNIQPSWLDQGGYDLFQPGQVLYYHANKYGYYSLTDPSHIEPYKSIHNDAIELFEMKDTDPSELEDEPDHNGRVAEHVTPEMVEEFRNGDNVVTQSAWTVDEIVGTEGVRLVPNEYHRHYDRLNFDEVFLEYSDSDERTIASLASNRFDYASANVRPSVANQFADAITQKNTPAATGFSIGINHRDVFGDYRVRHAIMYALNKTDIAENVHPNATEPVTVPGWDNWGIQDILDESWADNLTDYSQDLDEAERLMQEAGLERNSSDQWTYEDEALEFTLPTAEENPIVENTFASQMGDFGITVEVQPMDEATHQEAILGDMHNDYIDEEYGGSTEYEMWGYDAINNGFAGNYNYLWMDIYRGMNDAGMMRQRNWYDHEIQEDVISGETGGDPNYSEEGELAQRDSYEELTMDIPEVGDPHGDRSNTLAPSWMAGLVSFGNKRTVSPWPDHDLYDTPDDEQSEANSIKWIQTYSWLVNWFMPAWPLVMNQNQHYLNTGNWIWANELGGEDNEYLWQYFGDWNANHLTAQSRVLADPENPKGDAEVVER